MRLRKVRDDRHARTGNVLLSGADRKMEAGRGFLIFVGVAIIVLAGMLGALVDYHDEQVMKETAEREARETKFTPETSVTPEVRIAPETSTISEIVSIDENLVPWRPLSPIPDVAELPKIDENPVPRRSVNECPAMEKGWKEQLKKCFQGAQPFCDEAREAEEPLKTRCGRDGFYIKAIREHVARETRMNHEAGQPVVSGEAGMDRKVGTQRGCTIMREMLEKRLQGCAQGARHRCEAARRMEERINKNCDR